MRDQRVRVFVGTDRSQLLAVKVLEHSIRRHTSLEVEVKVLDGNMVPPPKDPRNGQRTGFSFSRFCIPNLCQYTGRAIYMDADMLVFSDIRELWEHDFKGGSVVVQTALSEEQSARQKKSPYKRKIQCSVMLLNCEMLDWDIKEIVAGLDANHFSYEDLMDHLCIVEEDKVRYSLPFEWNSLESYTKDATRLIHYTDMQTQPWVSAWNKNDDLWLDEVKLMLKNGTLKWSDIEDEIRLGYFRPSLIFDIKVRSSLPKALHFIIRTSAALIDKLSKFEKHKTVNEFNKTRKEAIKNYLQKAGAATT